MIYSIYDKTTGEIRRVIRCPKEQIEIQLDAGESYLEQDSDDATQYVRDGALATKPSRPTERHVWNWDTYTWDSPSADAEYEYRIETALARRADLLAASDWTQLPDVPLATKEKYAEYRQRLRDITKQPGYPHQIHWPTEP